MMPRSNPSLHPDRHSRLRRLPCTGELKQVNSSWLWSVREVFLQAPLRIWQRLTITIDAMQVLPPPMLAPVLAWVQALSYPWSSTEEATRLAPAIELLAPVLQRLASYEPGV